MRYIKIIVFLMILTTSVFAQDTAEASHPRLWIRANDLDRLRSWAVESNPIWVQINSMAEEAAINMDSGIFINGDLGGNSYEEYPRENYAMLFAFVSLVHPDEAQRLTYAQRARTLLMEVLQQSALGFADGQPFRDSYFPVNDRSRWYGAAFPLNCRLDLPDSQHRR